MRSEPHQERIMVMGCGSSLRGNDAFGPEVISYLMDRHLPEGVELIDAGTGGPYLLNILNHSDFPPKTIILVDAGDYGGKVGAISYFCVKKAHEPYFPTSLHDWSLLSEMRRYKGKVILLLCQVPPMENRLELGLAPEIISSVPVAGKIIMRILGGLE